MENQRQPASQPSDPFDLLWGMGRSRTRRNSSEITGPHGHENVNARPVYSRLEGSRSVDPCADRAEGTPSNVFHERS